MNRKLLGIIGITLIAGSATFLLNDSEEKPNVIDNGEVASSQTQALNFQGTRENIKLTDKGIKLDTESNIRTEALTDADKVLGTGENSIFIQREGNVFRYSEGSSEEIGINSRWGAVAGDFNFDGFNLIYADDSRAGYVTDLETGSSTKLFDNVLSLEKTDANGDGLSSSAKVNLMNGSSFVYEDSSETQRTDIDKDGIEERVYTKNNGLFMYDKEHGEEKISDTSSYTLDGKKLYTANGKLSEVIFEQENVDSGVYRSEKTVFNSSINLRQLIVDASLNGGTINAEIVTPDGNQSVQIQDGSNSYELDVNTGEVMFVFRLDGGNPLLSSYQLVREK